MKQAAITLGIIGLMLAALLANHIISQRADSAAFEEIKLGESISTVVAVLGEPDEVRSCSETLFWGDDSRQLGSNDGRCTQEYYYASVPGGWSVGFSGSGEVVAKYAYVSP